MVGSLHIRVSFSFIDMQFTSHVVNDSAAEEEIHQSSYLSMLFTASGADVRVD